MPSVESFASLNSSLLNIARARKLPSREEVDDYVAHHELAQGLDFAANDVVKHMFEDPWCHIALHCLDRRCDLQVKHSRTWFPRSTRALMHPCST